MVAGKTGARKPVSTANHWKVVAAVVGGLCLIVVLALLFQRHPAEQEDAAAPSAANTPAPFSGKAGQTIEKVKAAQDEQGRSRSRVGSSASACRQVSALRACCSGGSAHRE